MTRTPSSFALLYIRTRLVVDKAFALWEIPAWFRKSSIERSKGTQVYWTCPLLRLVC